MKKNLPLALLFFLSITSYCQTLIIPPPSDVFISKMTITGKTHKDYTAVIDLGNGKKLIDLKPDSNGFFVYHSEELFDVGSTINLFVKDKNNVESVKIPVKILSDEEYINDLKKKKELVNQANQRILLLEAEKKKIDEQNEIKEQNKINKLNDSLLAIGYKIEKNNNGKLDLEKKAMSKFEAEKFALKNTTLVYSSTVISTNFSIPLVRFNFIKGDDSKQGDILLFNSIGAGIGIYGGRLERTRDKDGEIINEEFSNRLGASIGAIFSAGTGEDTKNVFAPVFNLALLDFQIGVGVELGSLGTNQKREFVTLSYSIPLYKLFKKSYYLWLNNPEPIESIRRTQQ